MGSILLLIDFKKAFDCLSHKYIDERLKMLNFGQSIRRWINLFFNNREAYILLGGEITKEILFEQGVPQGAGNSPYIFILAVEILLIRINYTKHMEGITYTKKESKSETFADNTSIFVKKQTNRILEIICGNLETLFKDLRPPV